MKNKQMPISARRNRLAALVSVCTLAAGAVCLPVLQRLLPAVGLAITQAPELLPRLAE